MTTAMNDIYINALLADASYVDDLDTGQANSKLASRLTQPLADFVAGNDLISGSMDADYMDDDDDKTIISDFKTLNKQACNPHRYWLAERKIFNLNTQKPVANDATYNNTNERIAA